LSMVAMTISSRTPPFAPLATISLMMSNSEPKTQLIDTIIKMSLSFIYMQWILVIFTECLACRIVRGQLQD
jgi:hypothetical protein